MIKAEIIADSVTKDNRITSMILTYPRIIHAEFMTHRMFSRNAASSRAIPAKKMIEQINKNPFIPIAFQKAHKGMQGTEYIDGEALELRKKQWLLARDYAVEMAESLSGPLTNFGGEHVGDPVTKQLSNRLLEPFQWYQCIVTATEWENFFQLRCPQYYDGVEFHRSKKDYLDKNDPERKKDYTSTYWQSVNDCQAEIHIQALAEAMWDAMDESTPDVLKPGEWHIPFGDMMTGVEEDNRVKIATARCARVSYKTLGSNPEINFSKDIQLHDQLLEMWHMSPFEHCARAMNNNELDTYTREEPRIAGMGHLVDRSQGWCRNFRGFIQYREFKENGRLYDV